MKQIIKETFILFFAGLIIALIGMWIYPENNFTQYVIILWLQIIVWMLTKHLFVKRK